jgi:hypothetical protein
MANSLRLHITQESSKVSLYTLNVSNVCPDLDGGVFVFFDQFELLMY